MKAITKMSRLTGQLEKAFRMLNTDFFENQLPTPVITVTPTAKSFAHYTPWDSWETKGEGQREINISSAYLERPIENVIASLLHEMVHMYNDCITHVQDCSRNNTYHNGVFKREAEKRGLIITRSDRYGWSHTEPSDELILWICEHDEIRDIELSRTEPTMTFIGTHSNNGGTTTTTIGKRTRSKSIKYICPCCGNSVKATKEVRIACLDCNKAMIAQ